MQQIWKRDLPLRRAFGVSLGLHMLFALFFPILDRAPGAGALTFERISFTRVPRIHIAIAKHRRPVPVALMKPAAVRFTAKRPAARDKRIARRFSKTAAVPAAYVAAAQSAAGVNGSQPSSAPDSNPPDRVRPAATGAPNVPDTSNAPNSAGKRDVGGVMPFGADLPEPVLDPRVRAELGRRLRAVHVTLIVDVGDDGRTKNVEFHPPLDARLQAEISALLAAANWDAAVCGGGIPCAGRATITL